MIETLVTSKAFITFFLFSPFLVLAILAVFARITKRTTNALGINFLQIVVTYTVVHALLSVLVFIFGKQVYQNIFFGENAQVFWLTIAISLLINLYIGFISYNPRAAIAPLIGIIITGVVLALLIKAIIPLTLDWVSKTVHLISELSTTSPK